MIDKSMDSVKNPWKGLSSYTEKDQKIFLGRGRFINDLYMATSNNLFLTLYGKTGSGKTSLLHAGVFPLLRSDNFLPVTIRLRMCPSDMSFGRYIINRIDTVCRCNKSKDGASTSSISISKRQNAPSGNEPDDQSPKLLWHYFYSHDFIDEKGLFVFPVITIDQMEEGFNERHEDACLLLKQLYYLVGDDLLLPDECYANFRVIMSIREDYLYMIEDAIEDGGFQLLKQNRYRLSPLHEEDAREVVNIGRHFFEEGKEDEITEKIISSSKDETGHISTNMLSLICSQLFLQNNGNITEKMVNSLDSTSLMENYYLQCMSHVSEKTRKFIEEKMVNLDDGRRLIVRKDYYRKKLDREDAFLLLEGDYKIVQDTSAGSAQCYELIHDSLAIAIKKIKDDENRKKIEDDKIREENDSLQRQNESLQKQNLTLQAKNIKIAKERKQLGTISIFMGLVALILAGIIGAIYWLTTLSSSQYESCEVSIEFIEDSRFSIDEHWEANICLVDAENQQNINVEDMEGDSIVWPVHIVKSAQTRINFVVNNDSLLNRNVKLIIEPNTPLCKADTISFCIRDSLKFGEKNINMHVQIQKNVKKIIPFDGKILSSNNVPVKGAFVILGEQMRKTSEDGTFSFSLTDSSSLQNNNYLVIVKQEYGFSAIKLDSLLMIKDKKKLSSVDIPLTCQVPTDSVFKREFLNFVNVYNRKKDLVDTVFLQKYNYSFNKRYYRMYAITPENDIKIVLLRSDNRILGYVENLKGKGLDRYKLISGSAIKKENLAPNIKSEWLLSANGHDRVFGSWDISGTIQQTKEGFILKDYLQK